MKWVYTLEGKKHKYAHHWRNVKNELLYFNKIWIITLSNKTFTWNLKPFYHQCDKFCITFILYILNYIVRWTNNFENKNFMMYWGKSNFKKYSYVSNFAIPSFTWFNMYGMIYWAWNKYFPLKNYVSQLMKLSQYNVGIAFKLHNFA